MNADTFTVAPSLSLHLPVELPPSASFVRLIAVETRKFFDTRLSMILAALVLLGSVAVMTGFAAALGPNLQRTITISGLTLGGTLLPVMGILSVTSEWSQRTALSTFALEPRRIRVMIAKCFPPVIATLIASLFALGAAYAIVTLVASAQGETASLSLDPAALGGWAATNFILVLNGVAFGVLLLNAPAAIFICLASSLYWGFIALAGDFGASAAAWLDLNRTTGPLLDGTMTANDIGPLLVSIAAFVIAPFLLGLIRVKRKEMR